MEKREIISSKLSGEGNNATPAVISALGELGKKGGILLFEKGEYHFYEEGCRKEFFAVSNNSAGEKSIVFPLFNTRGLTVDGGGSTFVFHGKVFPFIADGCRDLIIKNAIIDRSEPHFVALKIRDVDRHGFGLEIDSEKFPFKIEKGSLIFKREWGEFSGLEKKLALHSADRFRVRYLFTGECSDSKYNLPVAYMNADATLTDYGARLTYREDENASECLFFENESLYVIVDGNRENDLIFLNECKGVTIENLTVRAAIGMGVIGQLSSDIKIKNFSTDSAYYGNAITISADAMHFVNCDGFLDISDCRITHTGDDILNVHGMYTLLTSADKSTVKAKIMHQEQRYFCPYRNGDKLPLIDKKTLRQIAYFKVEDFSVGGELGEDITLEGNFESGFEALDQADEILIENPERMPDMVLRNCYFSNYPHLRISGGGKMLVENSVFEKSRAAVLLIDLSDYWYESGRIKDFTFRGNIMRGCNDLGEKSFILAGVSGFSDADAPKIHEKIEISDNIFKGIKYQAITAGGVRELIMKNNSFDSDKEDIMIIDGKNYSVR